MVNRMMRAARFLALFAILFLAAEPAHADPISAAVSAVSSFIGGVGSFFAGLGAVGKIAVQIGLNLLGSVVTRALAGKGKQQPAAGVRLDVQYGEFVDRQIALGLCGVAGDDCYTHTYGSGNSHIQKVYLLSDYPCTSLERIAWNGEWKSLGANDPVKGRKIQGIEGDAWVKFHDGMPGQTADAGLVSTGSALDRWTNDHIGEGCAYVVVTIRYDREKLAQFPSLFFEFKGAPLYDRRKDSTAGGSGPQRADDITTHEYSENPIVMAENYERGFSVNGDMFCGKGMTDDELPFAEWVAGMNVCDEIVDGQPRYRCGLILSAGPDTPHSANLEAILQSCAATMGSDGVREYPLMAVVEPLTFTIRQSDAVAGTTQIYRRLGPLRAAVNEVSGNYPDRDAIWSPRAYGLRQSAVARANHGVRKHASLDFMMVPWAGQVDRLADIYLREQEFEALVTITLPPAFQTILPGDWGTYTRNDGTEHVMMAVQVETQDLESGLPGAVTITLRERGEEMFQPLDPNAPVVLPVPIPTPEYVSAVPNFNVVAVQATGPDGVIVPAIRASWTPIDDVTVQTVDIEYRVAGDTAITMTRSVPATASVVLLFEGVIGDTDYEVRADLTADPDRPTLPTEWKPVTTVSAVYPVSVGLEQVQGDLRGILERHSLLFEQLRRDVELLAADTAIGAGRLVEQTAVVKRTDRSLAAAIQTLEATATQTAANAEAITQINANVGDITAQGLFGINATVDGSESSVTIDLLGRVQTSDSFQQAGLSIYVDENGSKLLLNADQTVITKDGATASPFAFDPGTGELIGRFARFQEAVAEGFETPSGKARFGILAPGVEGVEITT
ncbi:phage tail protein [Oricola thermophila]|uniref:Uncharacterized protein n=1 Tax=Oricola thermophila TaxID=2742145 RepID=A0A6N1VCT2_9HYPH|nr:phage tail protein [Oricola thermophila]QKV18710.1 hypothetical protein HTY61_09740 [Oricola thermophila]